MTPDWRIGWWSGKPQKPLARGLVLAHFEQYDVGDEENALCTHRILRNTTNFKLSQYLRLPALAMAVVFWYKVALCAAWNLFGLPSSITCK